MKVYEGSPIFQGIAIGKIQYISRRELHIQQYAIVNIKKELDRFKRAKDQTLQRLYEVYHKTVAGVGLGQAQVFMNQINLLEKSSYANAIESLIRSEKVNASYAIATTRNELIETFSKLEDSMVKARMADISDVSEWLLNTLESINKEEYSSMEPVILAAEDLSPGQVMEMDQGNLEGLITTKGTAISHTAIIAKSMNLPALTNVAIEASWNDSIAILDGYTGTLYIDPDAKTMKQYTKLQEKDIQEQVQLLELRNKEDVTLDGTYVPLYANIGNLDELGSVLENNAAGVGLLRSEFQYLGRENYPREGELFRAYQKVAETMGDRLVVIRTLDVGADKQAEYMDLPQEENPALGIRGIRVCLERKKMFKAQLRAIYRASAFGNLAIMFPMVTSVEEIQEVKQIIQEVKEGLDSKNIPYKDIDIGIVVETPAAVMMIGELAKELDFLSIGTNDLTQYTLAMDKKNPDLIGYYDEHHPAVLRMIKKVIREGHKENCKVSICGELAADTKMTKSFLRMGVDALSVIPAYILPVRREIRSTRLTKKTDV